MFSIIEFCKYAGISRSFYYALQRKREGPAEIRIGSRVLIAKDTATEWLKGHEVAA